VGKITISVCKVYKNGRRYSFHRKKTKPAWKHYFLEENEPDEWKFNTEWVDSVTAQFLKLRKRHLRKFYCEECQNYFPALIKNDRTKVECPYCEAND